MIRIKVTNLPAYVRQSCSLRDQWSSENEYVTLWFRGHRASGWNLLPRLYRPEVLGKSSNHDHVANLEGEFRTQFARRSPPFLTQTAGSNPWNLYFLMQHYGMPTRLLDWTDSALLALFFAVARHDGKTDAAVWVLDPFWLNRRSTNSDQVYDPGDATLDTFLQQPYSVVATKKLPAALDPPHFDRRITSQRSHFTIHGRSVEPIEELAIAKGAETRLAKIVLPAASIESIRYDLQTCGITETAIFPDLEGLSRELLNEQGL